MTATLFTALVAAQADLPDIPKARTANAGSYSYAYADLADVLNAVRPVLKAHGLAVLQNARTEDSGIGVSTIIVHVSGEQLEFGPLVLPYGGSPQAAGSAITYARRYALLAALGLACDDDDGAAAQAAAHTRREHPQPPCNGGHADRGAGDSEPGYVRDLADAVGKGVGYVLTVARKVADGHGIAPPKSAQAINEGLAVLTAERLGVDPATIGLPTSPDQS